MLHEEVGAVRLPRDGVVLHRLENAQAGDGDLAAARRPFIQPHGPRENEGRFLAGRQRVLEEGLLPGFDDALARSGSVAHKKKRDLAAGSLAVEPASQRDFLPVMVPQIPDLDDIGHDLSPWMTWGQNIRIPEKTEEGRREEKESRWFSEAALPLAGYPETLVCLQTLASVRHRLIC